MRAAGHAADGRDRRRPLRPVRRLRRRSARPARRHGVPLIEDAAEALGATYQGGRAGGRSARSAAFSFNGNKIITTSGGGMLVSTERRLIERARYLATQARDPAPHYEHSEVGFNYRMSNLLAARRPRPAPRARRAGRGAGADQRASTASALGGPARHRVHAGGALRRARTRWLTVHHRRPGRASAPTASRPARAGGRGHRSAPGLEADAPPAGLRLALRVGGERVATAVRARACACRAARR